ncbi:MAG: hypothetical protein HC910_09665 [Spirulinaceae cyanobacterium SM2_1_0]|nr:hypothetical protein [Spirulinaceae cyanobacterium SM2_1_0]
MKQEYRPSVSPLGTPPAKTRRDRPSPVQPLLYISIMLNLSALVLLAGNLLLSGTILRRLATPPVTAPMTAEASLPTELDDLARQRLFAEVQALYNQSDFVTLYDRFDDYAKVQMDREQTVADLERMSELFQGIEEGIYTRFEDIEPQDGREFYNLYYQAKIRTPDGSRPGEVRIGVLRDSGDIGIVEFNITASQQAAPTE